MESETLSVTVAGELGLRHDPVDEAGGLGLAAAAQELADRLLSMPAGPVVMTEDHVNAVAQAMGPGARRVLDGDVLMGTLGDPASVEARERYMKKTFGK